MGLGDKLSFGSKKKRQVEEYERLRLALAEQEKQQQLETDLRNKNQEIEDLLWRQRTEARERELVESRRRESEKARRLHEQQAQDHFRAEAERHRQETERLAWQQHQRMEAKERAEAIRVADELRRDEREKQRRQRLQATSPEALRDLRDLIRTRYQLDVEIWSLRGTRRPMRPMVLAKMDKSDAVLNEIYSRLDSWEEHDWNAEEWKMAQHIKQRVLSGGQRWWEGNPPWENR